MSPESLSLHFLFCVSALSQTLTTDSKEVENEEDWGGAWG